MSNLRRVVYDCNIFVQSLINPRGPAGRCVNMARDEKVALYVSAFVLAEIREIHLKLPAKYGVTAQQTEALALAVASTATLVTEINEVFVYSRDPDDAHYVNLAVQADAKLIVSRDRDLLDLMDNSATSLGFQTRFPQLEILDPVEFLKIADETT